MTSLSVEQTCSEIHRLLDSHPVFKDPKQIPHDNGLYFFYEIREISQHAPNGRIVRIGNHPRSDNRLKGRLRDHYSTGKNSSVFRKFIGGALMRKEDTTNQCLFHWEKQDEPTCYKCKPLERNVSRNLRNNFWFRSIEIRDRELRNLLEKKLIATISSCRICKPSETWLGFFTYSENVKKSGLWNSDYVLDDRYILDMKELEFLKELTNTSE